MRPVPRVTLGIATYERDTYLAEAVASCLAQDFADLEVLVVADGGANPRVDEILDGFAGDPRLRVVRHATNRGIAEAYNTIWREGRGELVAMLGDDDVCAPDRIRRQVEVFDRHPDTGVVHGDATIIDGEGVARGRWSCPDLAPAALLALLVRRHNYLVDPTRMVHRRVYQDVGGYDRSYRLAQDFHFWLRAVPRHRFRHAGGEPLIGFRRHGENFSDPAARELEVEEVQRALREAIGALGLRTLVPELDWALLDERDAEPRALLTLADLLERRELPLPGLAAELRERAAGWPRAPRPKPNGRRILLTSFGFNDSGGGTTVPRLVSKELARRGWDVTVFHAAVAPDPSGKPYAVREWEEDGVRLVGVHNRAHGLWDLGHPRRELDDPPITAAFAQALDRVAPDVVHFHNLHNLGAALIDQAAARGIRSYFSTHNYWLICPRAYLLTGDGSLCGGPGEHGAACATCVGSADHLGHRERLESIRATFARGVDVCLAVSDAMKRTLVAQGYPPEMIDVVRQAVPAADEVWRRLGRDRRPGRLGDELVVGFFGSAYPHKGPQLLVEAAQRTSSRVRVLLHGEIHADFAQRLRELDGRGVLDIRGAFSPSELPELLAGVDCAVMPSLWWDCAPLMAAECLAGRVPLVVPRLGGLAEAVRDEEDGLLYCGFDAGDLAGRLDRLAGEPGLLERLQAAIGAPRAFSAYVDELERYYAGERPSRDDAETEPAPPAVRWVGDHGAHTSLSIVNDAVTSRLERGGAVRLQRASSGGAALDPPLPHAADVEVRHRFPADLRPAASGRLAVIQPWEFGALPRAWVAPMRDEVDELWVPSAYVREMYLAAGVAPDRVHVVPNGVDLERFRPDGERLALDAPDGARFLFVGGAVSRKGIDVLVRAWLRAFPEREDVALVVKDFGAEGIYRTGRSVRLPQLAAAGTAPRVLHLDADLEPEEMAALYRACDVLVHPYRAEGFAMPVLEAMASGLPVIATAGGPTDEFCPPEAGWRLRAQRTPVANGRVEGVETDGVPWWLEPDEEHLVELLRTAAAATAEERARRGAAGRAAAERLSWDAVAELYAQRARALARRPRRTAVAPAPVPGDLAAASGPRVLATPAWRGTDRLGELLAAWARAAPAGTPAGLFLLATPEVDGDATALEAHVLAAAVAAGADVEACADITILQEHATPGRDAALHAAADAYVPLHPACGGHERLARAAGRPVLAPTAGALRELLGSGAPAGVAP